MSREKEELVLELYKAHLKARRGKRKTEDENKFELHLWENLSRLAEDIINRTYKPSRGIAFVIDEPVPREIFAAPYRDRVVHHYLIGKILDFCDKQFIYDSASCREGKGTQFAVERAEHHMRSVSNNFREEAYVFKFDIKGYFMSMVREILYRLAIEMLDKQYPIGKRGNEYQRLKYLWGEIIFDNPIEGVRRRGNMSDWDVLGEGHSLFENGGLLGIVIGNLSSQVLSNILMNKFDRYVTMELGYKHYVRYVDDFVIFVKAKDKKRLQRDVEKLEKFLLEELHLVLHPKKRYVQEIHKGVEFIGARIRAGYKLPSRRIERNFYKAMRGYMKGEARYTEQTIISYLGILSHYKSVKIIKRGCEIAGMDYLRLLDAKRQGGNEVATYVRECRKSGGTRKSAGKERRNRN